MNVADYEVTLDEELRRGFRVFEFPNGAIVTVDAAASEAQVLLVVEEAAAMVAAT